MADIDSIVNIVITRSSQTISRASFSVPMLAGYHTAWTDRVRTYTASTMLATMVDEGFSTMSRLYLMAQSLLSQSPRPKKIKIGRLDSTWTQVVSIVPTAASSTVYNGRVNDQPWTFTSDADATLAEVCTGIAAAITALDGVSATSVGGTSVAITADAAATLFDVLKGSGAGVYSFSDTTAAGTIADEVAALRAADPEWYALLIDRRSEPAINAVAAWVETDKSLFIADSTDSGIFDPAVTTDVASDQSARKRTSIWASKYNSDEFAAAMVGLILPYDPGAANWAHKSPAGIQAPGLTSSEQDAALDKRANILVTVAGVTDTQWGTSGTDFLDNVQAEDWVRATMQEDVFAFLRSAPKIPYTDRSVARLVEVIRSVLQRGIDRGIIADSPAPVIEAPLVEEVSEIDRANRVLPDVTFSFRLSGAINTVSPITGLVSV